MAVKPPHTCNFGFFLVSENFIDASRWSCEKYLNKRHIIEAFSKQIFVKADRVSFISECF